MPLGRGGRSGTSGAGASHGRAGTCELVAPAASDPTAPESAGIGGDWDTAFDDEVAGAGSANLARGGLGEGPRPPRWPQRPRPRGGGAQIDIIYTFKKYNIKNIYFFNFLIFS
ncbi:UNVERIFIED_CONTAM: hypothetical protein Sradi_4850400 [Sesamum radiatum]|uniref:Uncharacterized protein n=1 Tax=Sesamum radiatum TaxID=300843 RepID=A0AAW2N0E3_SESRA